MRLPDDDIPRPANVQKHRNPMMARAAPILALAASIRSGRAQVQLQAFHAEALQALAEFDRAIIAASYPDDQRQRARYAVAATIDDIVQNLPGREQERAEWARRSLVVETFQEAIGGDRFWRLVADMLSKPAQYRDLIELYHACLAAGFEGRFRVSPDGRRELHDMMQSLFAALEHAQRISPTEVSPHWQGEPRPMQRVGIWSMMLLLIGFTAVFLVVVFAVLRLMLGQTGDATEQALHRITGDNPLTLGRVAAPSGATPSAQMRTLQGFLAPEIAQHLVVVEQDGSTLRVRTTVGQLFASGSDSLAPVGTRIFNRIAAAVETQPGAVTIEGHTDADRVHSVSFPDNNALARARADVVANLMRGILSQPSRITAVGFGSDRPIASNATAAGKSMNRRVEVVIPRTN
jgi:type VI secretion system protein ImpK